MSYVKRHSLFQIDGDRKLKDTGALYSKSQINQSHKIISLLFHYN